MGVQVWCPCPPRPSLSPCSLAHELRVSCMQRKKVQVHSSDPSALASDRFNLIMVSGREPHVDAGGIAAVPDTLCPGTGSHHAWLCSCQLHKSMCPLGFIVLTGTYWLPIGRYQTGKEGYSDHCPPTTALSFDMRIRAHLRLTETHQKGTQWFGSFQSSLYWAGFGGQP